ncbi:MAG: energy transducer TonB [Gammaproteobacteria bacterium]|jgi:TonB family protein|nr:TonB family protein [Gammaproteobacteria bacterium]
MTKTTKSGLAAAACILLTACAGSKPPVAQAPPPVPLMIASPVNDAAPAALETRLTVSEDSQMLLRFEVQADGSIQKASILMSKLPDETGNAVLAAFSSLRFRPYLEGGKPVARAFIYPLFFGPDAVSEHTRFFCRHKPDLYQPASRCDIVQTGSWQVYRVTPPYPDNLLTAPVTGAVTMSFDVGASGVPSNVKVMKSTPPGVFDTAAVVALQQWYFEPQDGSPTGAPQHASVTLNFTPPMTEAPPHD